MNILVTGGAGFIGSNIAKLLLNQGHTVTILDNLNTGKMENIIKRDMWSTPIWVADTGFDKYFNDLLLMELRNEKENNRFDMYNIWNVKSERLQMVREKLLELIKHELFDYLSENHPAG